MHDNKNLFGTLDIWQKDKQIFVSGSSLRLSTGHAHHLPPTENHYTSHPLELTRKKNLPCVKARLFFFFT